MSNSERNKEIVRYWLEEGVNKNIDLLDEVLHPEVVDHVGNATGIEWWRMMGEKLHTTFPDLEFTIEDIFAEGDKVALRLTMRGTHRGTEMPMLAGVEPTGKQVVWSHIHLFRLEDGKIMEHWATRDDLSMMRQLGIFT